MYALSARLKRMKLREDFLEHHGRDYRVHLTTLAPASSCANCSSHASDSIRTQQRSRNASLSYRQYHSVYSLKHHTLGRPSNFAVPPRKYASSLTSAPLVKFWRIAAKKLLLWINCSLSIRSAP